MHAAYKGLRLRICTDSIFVTNQVFMLSLKIIASTTIATNRTNEYIEPSGFSVYACIVFYARVPWRWTACVPQLHACTCTVRNIIASYRNSSVEEFITKVASIITNLNVFTKWITIVTYVCSMDYSDFKIIFRTVIMNTNVHFFATYRNCSIMLC